MKTLFHIVTLVVILATCACTPKSKNECSSSGLIINTGPVAVDGCDWTITIDGKVYHPENLDTFFKQDSMTMYMDYQLTDDTFICGWGNKLPVVRFTCTYWPEE